MSNIAQPPEVTNIINVLNTYLKWKSLNGPPRGYLSYHPSSFGGCLRKVQYQRYTDMGLVQVDKEVPEAKNLRIFDTGHSMHARWAKYFEDIGVLRGVWECANAMCASYDDSGILIKSDQLENALTRKTIGKPRKYGKDNKLGCFKPDSCVCGSHEFEYHEITVHHDELNFHGHCDQILDFSKFDSAMFAKGNAVDVLFRQEDLPKKPIVLDMKSINSNSFRSKLEHGPSLIYRTQLVIYCNILDLEYGVLLYENKDDCSTKIYKVDRNPEMWEVIKSQAQKMNDLIADKMLPPPRPISKVDYDCRYCEYQSICHKSKIWEDPDLADKRLKFYGNF
jgi:CRISPR/Cas system-associated exonuclease Cas4 (RecB family)